MNRACSCRRVSASYLVLSSECPDHAHLEREPKKRGPLPVIGFIHPRTRRGVATTFRDQRPKVLAP